MEEALLAQALDLVVDPVQQGGVALAHSGGNGILAAQRGDAHRVAGVLLCKSDDLGVVVGPCYAIAVFQRVLGGCIGIILLQGNVGIFLGQVGLGGGAGNDDHLIVGVPVVQTGDDIAVRRDDTQCNVHVGQCKVHLLSALGRDGEVCQNDIDLAGLQVLNAVGGLCGNEVSLHTQILGQAAGEVDIIALILAVLVHIAERVLVGENADVHGAVRLDLVQRAEHVTASSCGRAGCSRAGSGRGGGCAAAAGRKQGGGGNCAQTQQEGTTRDLVNFHGNNSFPFFPI